jgi:hypothetical protein
LSPSALPLCNISANARPGLLKRLAGRFKDRLFARECGVSLQSDLDIPGFYLAPKTAAAELLGGDHGGAGAEEGVNDQIVNIGTVPDGPRWKFDWRFKRMASSSSG